jgi:hypothetical protein
VFIDPPSVGIFGSAPASFNFVIVLRYNVTDSKPELIKAFASILVTDFGIVNDFRFGVLLKI